MYSLAFLYCQILYIIPHVALLWKMSAYAINVNVITGLSLCSSLWLYWLFNLIPLTQFQISQEEYQVPRSSLSPPPLPPKRHSLSPCPSPKLPSRSLSIGTQVSQSIHLSIYFSVLFLNHVVVGNLIWN